MYTTTDNPPTPPNLRPYVEAFCLLFIPYVLGFFLRSYEMLRAYIGFCFTPLPTIEPLPELTKKPDSLASVRRRRMIIATLVFSTISTLQLKSIMKNFSPQLFLDNLRIFYQYFMYACLFGVVVKAANEITKMERYFMYRTSTGKWFRRNVTTKKQTQWFGILGLSIFFFAFSMIWGLSAPNNTFSIGVVTMAYVYEASKQKKGKKQLRRQFKAWCYLAFMAFAIVVISKKYRPNESQAAESLWTSGLFKELNFIPFISVAICSYFSGPLIARALRMDYEIYMDKNMQDIKLDVVTDEPLYPVITFTGEKLGRGIENLNGIFPPIKFPKPYYTTALLTWSFIRIGTILLCIIKEFPAKSLYDACTLGFFLELPVIMAAMMSLAAIRGEAGSLWNYHEVWNIKPLPQGDAPAVPGKDSENSEKDIEIENQLPSLEQNELVDTSV